jgi:dipeptidyl aminopeptidase/acylaminoacyl peptidase
VNRALSILLPLLLLSCDRAQQPDPEPAVAAPAPAPEVNADPDVPSGTAAARDAELAQQLAQYVDAFTNSNATFSRDGGKIVFQSNRDGLPQLYVADTQAPEAPATRLTQTTERVIEGLSLPDGKHVLYASDKGADENWSFFVVPVAGGEPRELTPGQPLNRDFPFVPEGLPEGAPTTLFYSARERTNPATTLWSLSLEPGAQPTKVYAEEKTGFLMAVSRDGKWGLWLRYPSRTDNTLLLVELGTGQTRQLWPADPASGPVNVPSAEFSPDGKLVYVTTDGGGEQSMLLALDRETGKEKARYVEPAPSTAGLTGLAVAPRGGAVALTVDAGNRTEVRLLDGVKLKPRAKVELPLGTGGVVDFSEDGKWLSLNRSTPDKPADVFAVDVATGAVRPLRTEPRPTITEMAALNVSIQELKTEDGLVIPINVVLPADLPADKKLPVIVHYHGGPSASSYIRWNPVQRFFTSQGYAWVEPNVRGSNGFGRAFEMADNGPKRLDAFEDVEASARWVAAQPWADPDKLVVYGGSYGGYTVLTALARWPDLWAAGVDLFGVVNLDTFLRTTSGLIREVFVVEFGDVDKDAAFLKTVSPIETVDQIEDPLFVYAGANDPRVPRSESDQVVKALRARDVPIEYMVAENEGHSVSRRETQLQLSSRVARFLEEELAAAEEAAAPAPAPAP